jgi:MFS family permease
MSETKTKLLSDSKAARWTALFIVSFTMMCGYLMADVISPLKTMLESTKGWNSQEYGFYNSAYGWFNVFLFMLILGGMLLDRIGERMTGILATLIMIAGTWLAWYSISTHSFDNQMMLGFKKQVLMASIGYAIFGVGIELVGITASKVVVKWFKGKELAMGMGLQVATARIGTGLALIIPLPLASYFGDVAAPVMFCLIILLLGLFAFFAFNIMDRKLDKSLAELGQNTKTEEDVFRFKDVVMIVTNKGFWLLALLCVTFYSGVFPFIKYATDLMIQKFHVSGNLAGAIPSLLPVGTMIMTPIFGGIYDKKGKGATIMILGAFLLLAVHLIFSIPFLSHWFVAIILMIVLGVSFSLVPAAMWPSVPKIIPEKQLGTAYAIIFWLQNMVALTGVPYLIGWILDAYCVTGHVTTDSGPMTTYSYTVPMLVFSCFGVLALVFAYWLRAEDKAKQYGLELPNIRK